MKNYYRNLGVSVTATEKEIRTAYRQLVLQYHPDRNSSPDAATRFIQIQEAYETLGNEQSRVAYDNMRKWHQQSQYAGNVHEHADNGATRTYTTRTYRTKPANRQSGGINWLRLIIPLIVTLNLLRQCANSGEPKYTTVQYNTTPGTSYFVDSSGALHATTSKPDSNYQYKPAPLK
jgi:curved DNA-binding protein CbpA